MLLFISCVHCFSFRLVLKVFLLSLSFKELFRCLESCLPVIVSSQSRLSRVEGSGCTFIERRGRWRFI